MSGDHLRALTEKLDDLEAAPVTAHPQILDGVHRGLVDELDRLAGIVSGDSRSTTGRHAHSG